MRMASRRARRCARKSGLSAVEINYAERELDEEFGVLPGEERDEEDLGAEMDVLAGLTQDGRTEEGLWDGRRAEGVWRSVIDVNMGSEDSHAVARWVVARGRAPELRVMDPYCVEVVRRVLDLKNV